MLLKTQHLDTTERATAISEGTLRMRIDAVNDVTAPQQQWACTASMPHTTMPAAAAELLWTNAAGDNTVKLVPCSDSPSTFKRNQDYAATAGRF
jgi:hypothetical protein